MSNDFTLQLGKVAKLIDVRAQVVVKKVALDIYTGITRRNPVDTGYSRAAWNISLAQPDDSLPGDYKKGVAVPPPDIARKQTVLNGDILNELTYITNAVHYVPYLEGGSSKQAPAGMVMVTVEQVVSEIDQFIQQAQQDNPL